MKKLVWALALAGVFFASGPSRSDTLLTAAKTDIPPKIDGSHRDPAWARAREATVTDPVAHIKLRIKAVYSKDRIWFLVRFKDPDESRLHKPWIWNSRLKRYEPGPQREDCVVLKWALTPGVTDLSLHAEQPYRADIWFWKAHRTDPSGFADDKWQLLTPKKNIANKKVLSRSGRIFYLVRRGDQGSPAYRNVLPLKYKGRMLAQFTPRRPSGSRGDIRAKGVWARGEWCVELGRALNTGHKDDVRFDIRRSYRFGISRYEIAGRKPDPRLTQPLYGSGDVTTLLTLTFQK